MINRGFSHLYKYALIWVGKEGVPAGEHFIDGRYWKAHLQKQAGVAGWLVNQSPWGSDIKGTFT